MSDPVLHLLAGPNGAGKSTLYSEVLGPVSRLEFVNADVIAAELWPGEEVERSYDAAQLATKRRDELLAARTSFVTETVFSHPSKVQLLRDAEAAGYRTTLHIVAIPVDLAVVRVRIRARLRGHDVPEAKIRARYDRLWDHVVDAIDVVDEAVLYDNSSADAPFVVIARWNLGTLVNVPDWPAWTPPSLVSAGR